MNLSVLDRILLFGILPKEGDVTTVRIVRKLREDLSFSEDEQKLFEIATKDGTVTWNSSTAVDKDILISAKAQVVITDALERMNKEKKLSAEFLPLYDLFIPADV